MATAREALAVCRDETYARRAISALPPAARARILATLEGTSTSV